MYRQPEERKKVEEGEADEEEEEEEEGEGAQEEAVESTMKKF